MSADSNTVAAAAVPTRLENLANAVARVLPELRPSPNTCGEVTCEVAPERLLQTAALLRDAPELKFEMCMDVCGVDYLEHGRAEWKTQDATSSGFSRGVARGPQIDAPVAPGRRFAVVYHLLSVSLNQRLRLRVFCPDDAEPMVDSWWHLGRADWFERETFDMLASSSGTSGCLATFGFIGHPFRKDFPLSGNVEVAMTRKGPIGVSTSEHQTAIAGASNHHDNRYTPALTNAPVASDGSQWLRFKDFELRSSAPRGTACWVRRWLVK
jgi:NADH-quinone oxidoreductase subunit C